jgi:hypothetical protein
MKTKQKYLVGAGILAALGGLAWWNRYVVLVVTPSFEPGKTAATFAAVRAYAFTEAGARAAAATASKTAKVGQAVYITQRQKVLAMYNVGTDVENKGADSAAMTAQATNFGMPLAGMR